MTRRKTKASRSPAQLVRQKCSALPSRRRKGRLTRISYRRTTPEGWEETIKRMVTLNDVKLEPADAREILRYLADHHGLAPEEAQPGAFEVERRMIDYKYTADKDTEDTCIKCHSFGRVLLQRRTKEEWELLIAMHRGYYPLVDFQAFRRGGPPPARPAARPRRPSARQPPPDGEGASRTCEGVSADDAGVVGLGGDDAAAAARRAHGRSPAPSRAKAPSTAASRSPRRRADAGDFTTETTLTYARTGKTVTRRGRAIVYTGFQWRGRSPDDFSRSAVRRSRLARRQRALVHRRLRRVRHRRALARSAPIRSCSATAEPRVKTGAAGQEVHIFGANLPAQVDARRPQLRPRRHGRSRRQRDAERARRRGVGRAGRDRSAPRGLSSPARPARPRSRSTTRSISSRCCRRPGWRASAARISRSSSSSSRRSRSPTDPTASRTPKTTSNLGLVDADVERRGIHRHLRRRRQGLRRHDRRDDRPVHAERRRPEPEAQARHATTIGDVWVVASYQRAGVGQRRSARSRRGRTCWSPCRST